MNNPRYKMTGYDSSCPYHPKCETNWEWSDLFCQYVPSPCIQCIKDSEDKYNALPQEEKDKIIAQSRSYYAALKEIYDYKDLVPESVKMLNGTLKRNTEGKT